MKKSLGLFVVTAIATGMAAPAIAADAQEHWTKNCALCHGTDGSGNTMMGKRLKLKDYTNPDIQAAMTDEQIIAATKEGVKDDTGKQIMKGYADKIPEEDLPALVALIRSFKKE